MRALNEAAFGRHYDTPSQLSLRRWARAIGGLALALWFNAAAAAQAPSPIPMTHHPATPVSARASGTFDVKLTPQPADAYADGSSLGRLTIDKQFHGDLDATSKGQMLSAMTSVKGSAGYVAVERVSGTLAGRRGTFVLQHAGTMSRNTPQLTVTVVPDSGTEELAGLSGTMTIDTSGGRHAYEFPYTLPRGPYLRS